ncbi:MAG: shikimate kinase AroK [Thiomargarita sp.]|nr:shikimate kinase AroK [Thiomargarita sp.]
MRILNNIFFIGPMGVGKTTIARHLADELNMIFIDSDHEIEKQAGVTIPFIFELEGEIGFRQREEAIIAELTAQSHIILSTGGGVILNDNNRQLLRNRGNVIYLHASINDLLERTAHSHNRPLLKTKNPRKQLEMLLKERHSLYQAIANVTIETGGCSICQVVTTVLKYLENNC